MHPTSRRTARGLAVAIAAVAALALGACTAEPEGTGGAVPSEAPAEPIAGTFDVGGGRQLYLECAGTGYPRVVIIPGQRAGVVEWQTVGEGQTAEPVFSQLAAQTRVCSYDRPGVPFDDKPASRSDPVPMPTNAADMVADLHALLAAAGEAGPAVIVAHSLGGLPALLYAETYPDDILGIVMVDALSPTLRDAFPPELWETQKALLTGGIEDTLREYPDIERVDWDASFDSVAEGVPNLPEVPFILITADHPWGPIAQQAVEAGQLPAIVPADFGYILDDVQKVSRPATLALFPGGTWIKDTDSGHIMHHDQPQLIADTVLGMVDEVRAAG